MKKLPSIVTLLLMFIVILVLAVAVCTANATASAEESEPFEVKDLPATKMVLAAVAVELGKLPIPEIPPVDIPEDESEEVYYEPVFEWYDEEPAYYAPAPAYSGGTDLQTDGVVYGDDGTRYTWYSQNVLPGGGLDIPGRSVSDEGYVVDGDGNIAVASSDYEYGTQLETPWGDAVVYDTGCASGTVDVYTSW